SGRCATRSAGTLTGKSCGSCRLVSSKFPAGAWLGNSPASVAMRSRSCAACFSNGGRGGLNLPGCRLSAARSSPVAWALPKLVLQDLQDVGVDVDELVGCFDLQMHGTLLDGRNHYICGQGVVGGDRLEAHGFRLRLGRLYRTAVQPEDIRHVGNRHFRREKIEGKGVRRQRRGDHSRLPLTSSGKLG